MNVFFDTEFTHLRDARRKPKLISIGCVAQDGREFYAEPLDTWQPSDCSDFVVQTVLPLLQGGDCRINECKLAVRLKEWVEGLTDKKVIFRSDAPSYDWQFLEYLFTFYGCWPKNLRRECGTIYFNHDHQINRYQDALAEYWKTHAARQHHALVDARCQLFAWKQAIRRGL